MLKTARVAAAAAVLFVATAVWILGGWSRGTMVTIIDDIVLFVLAVIAVVLTGLAARSTRGRLRAAWSSMMVGVLGWAMGELMWTYFELVLHQAPFPTVADAGFLLLPVGACVALLLFPAEHTTQSIGRLFLDGLIVAGSLFLVSWVTILGAVYEAGANSRFKLVVSLAYPVSDVVLLTVAAVVLVKAGTAQRLALTLLTVGMACIALSDSTFSYLATKDEYASGNPIDLGWAAGLLFISVAAAAGREDAHHDQDSMGLPGWASIWLPYAPLLLAAVVAAANPPRIMQGGPVEAIGALLVAAVLCRQFLAVSENRQLLATVAEQALRDPLTGLANRALFNDRLNQAMNLRDRGRLSVGVIALDLNDFKLVNDTLGHPAGDELLNRAAERILGCVRAGDTVARLGGDEFVVLIVGTEDHSHLLAHRIAEAFDQSFEIAGHELAMHPSIGLAVAEPDEPDVSAELLLSRADLAMYTAKRARTRGVQSFSLEMESLGNVDMNLLRRAPPSRGTSGAGPVHLLAELRQAIGQFELALVYQPKFDLRTMTIVGVEALLRWPHPERGLLSPADFLPLVRRHGLMGAVTEFVLNKALDDAVTWRSASIDVPVAINVFAPSLSNLSLPASIAKALADRDLSASALSVEITEDLFLDNMQRTQIVLQQLRQQGIRIAIDDFGSGCSALSYLRDLPIDEVKLDRDFIAPIWVDPRAAAVVLAVIDLAHVLDLLVVVEGVEDAKTATFLREYGCDMGQGFFYSPPVTSDELIELLRRPAENAPPSASAISTS